MAREPLAVWLWGEHVATIDARRPGEVRCRYTSAARERWDLNTPLLSCSLPLDATRRHAGNFFAGLLPEGRHRQAIADAARVPTYDTFGILARFGRDVAGAVVIGDGPDVRPGEVLPYRAEELAADVAALPDHPLGLHDDSELSLPGLQDKLLLVALDGGGWGRPVHGYPSTHILKVEDPRFARMAQLEAACLRLATRIGVSTVDVAVETIANEQCLIVSRFDRATDAEGRITRIHQEDACQALDLDPSAANGRGKYESAGGPSLVQIAALLDRHAADPVRELCRLVRAVTFNLVIGNADAHGKNVAYLHTAPGVVELAPLYDTVPTVLWPKLRADAAMAVAGRHDIHRIDLDGVATEAHGWGMDRDAARDVATECALACAEAIGDVDAPEELVDLVRQRTEAFLEPRESGAS